MKLDEFFVQENLIDAIKKAKKMIQSLESKQC